MAQPYDDNWIAAFVRKHGRPPRILHFGNICNNAYQNAKMLNAAGADCDVLSVDYYHIMGAPEWEDADFTGDYGDQYYPAWHRVDLHGFVRPAWFAASHRQLAVAYLLARRQSRQQAARRLWRRMERWQRYLARKAQSPHKALWDKAEKLADMARMALRYLLRGPGFFALKMRKAAGRLDDAARAKLRRREGTEAMVRRVHEDFAAAFPGVAPLFGPRLDDCASDALAYRQLFDQYDMIHAYSADPVWPYLAGAPHYVAYENGTLRGLPQAAQDEFSQLLMLAYAKAGAVMTTNTDCYESAVAVTRHTGTPLVFGLHGIDVQRILTKMETARQDQGFDARFGVEAGTPLFFCPSRHTWEAGAQRYIKGEDKAIAAANRLAQEGHHFALVMVDWGADVPRVQALLATMPALAPKVQWIKPIDKLQLHKVFGAVDAVLDQFALAVFGAITIEVLCAGNVLISNTVADERMCQYFGATLPYYACKDADTIYAAMKTVLCQPQQAKALSVQGPAWVQAHHSAGCIVARCLCAYRAVL